MTFVAFPSAIASEECSFSIDAFLVLGIVRASSRISSDLLFFAFFSYFFFYFLSPFINVTARLFMFLIR